MGRTLFSNYLFSTAFSKRWRNWRIYSNLFVSCQVTSNHKDGYGTVDYIFFSTVYSQRHGNWVEGNLKLLSRLNLLSGKEVHTLGGLPSMAFPSDHLCLVAKFLLRRSRKWPDFLSQAINLKFGSRYTVINIHEPTKNCGIGDKNFRKSLQVFVKKVTQICFVSLEKKCSIFGKYQSNSIIFS